MKNSFRCWCIISTLIFISESGDDFLPVQRNTDILMGVSVEVMTRAAEGDPEHLHVIFKDDKGQSAGSLEIVLKESSTYHFGQCSGFREYFPSVVPTGMEKTWSIQKTIVNEEIRVQLRCNDVQVLDVVLSDTVCNNGEMGDTWKSYWEQEIVVINFLNEDTASTSYKIIGEAGFQPIDHSANIVFTNGQTIHVITSSSSGSGDTMQVMFQDSTGQAAGSVQLTFTNTLSYQLGECSASTQPLPESLLLTESQVTWQIKRTRSNSEIRVTVSSSGEEVFNTVLDDTVCDSTQLDNPWRTYWEREISSVNIPSADTASHYYKVTGEDGFDHVLNNMNIDILNGMTVHVKTTSILGNGDRLQLQFLSSSDESAGSFHIVFRTEPAYFIGDCSGSYEPLSGTLPEGYEKTWSFRRTKEAGGGIRVQIGCGEFQLLDILLTDTVCSSSNPWRNYWERDVAKINFPQQNIASPFYKITAIHGTHKEVKTGTDATISCIVAISGEFDSVFWKKGDDDVTTISSANYVVDEGTFAGGFQTTTLTVKAAVNTADTDYKCVVTAAQWGGTSKEATVALNVFDVLTEDMTVLSNRDQRITCSMSDLSAGAHVTWIKPDLSPISESDTDNYIIDNGLSSFTEGRQTAILTIKRPVMELITSETTYKSQARSNRYYSYSPVVVTEVTLTPLTEGGEGFILVERNTPLFVVLGMTVHVKTLTKSGSGDILFLHYGDSEGRGAGSFQVKFADQPSYYLGECSGSWVPLSEDLPVEMAKTWSIKRTVTNIYNKIIRVEVSCNEVQLLNITLDETICDSSELDRPWRNNWERQAASVLFSETDTASNFYRLKEKDPCPLELYAVYHSTLVCEIAGPVETCTLTCDTENGYSFNSPSSGDSLVQTCDRAVGLWSYQTPQNFFAKWKEVCTKRSNPVSRNTNTVVYLQPDSGGELDTTTAVCPNLADINSALVVLHERNADLFLCLEEGECEQLTDFSTCEVVDVPVKSLKLTVGYRLKSDLSDFESMQLLAQSMNYTIVIGEYNLKIGPPTGKVPYTANREYFTSIADHACSAGYGKIGEFCSNCPKGYFMNAENNQCDACPPGTYTDKEGALDCDPCGAGMTTFQDKSTMSSDCVYNCVVQESNKGTVMPPPQWNIPRGDSIHITCDEGNTTEFGVEYTYKCGETPPHCYSVCSLEELPQQVMLIPHDMTRHFLYHGNTTTVHCADRSYYHTLTCDDGYVNWPDCTNTSPNFTWIGKRIYILFAAAIVLGIILSFILVVQQSLRKQIDIKFNEIKPALVTNIENPMKKTIIHLPIHMEEFSEKVERYNAKEMRKWKTEFNSIPKFDPEQKTTIAKSTQNRKRNNFNAWNIVPYNVSRVLLSEGDVDYPQSDYYNASYLNGWRGPREYIVAQTPIYHTAAEFWRIFIDLDCRILVHLHPTVDANFPDYYKFWPNEEGVYDDRVLVRVVPDTTMTYTGFTERLFTVGPLKRLEESIKSVSDIESEKDGTTTKSRVSGTEGYVDKDEESTERKPARGAPKEIFTQTGDSMEGSNAGDDGSEAGSKVKGSQSEEIVSQVSEVRREWDSSFEMKQMIFDGWTEEGEPDMECFTNLLYYYRSFAKIDKTKKPPVISSEFGSDWAAIFCGTDYILDRILDEPQINIAGVTDAMRQQRPMMIANVEQYKYFHELVKFILRSEDFEDLKDNGFERSTPKRYSPPSSTASTASSLTLFEKIKLWGGGMIQGWIGDSSASDLSSISSMSSQESIV